MKILRLFNQPVVVEVSTPRYVPTKDDEAAIETLKNHPGFEALTARLSLQRRLLEGRLKNERLADMREVDFLQNGIHWISYLEREVERRVHKRDRNKSLAASAYELEEFQNVSALIERIEPQNSK